MGPENPDTAKRIENTLNSWYRNKEEMAELDTVIEHSTKNDWEISDDVRAEAIKHLDNGNINAAYHLLGLDRQTPKLKSILRKQSDTADRRKSASTGRRVSFAVDDPASDVRRLASQNSSQDVSIIADIGLICSIFLLVWFRFFVLPWTEEQIQKEQRMFRSRSSTAFDMI